jgi:hypothetical protein
MAIRAAVVQKSSQGGWKLRVSLVNSAGKTIDSAATGAEFGVVSVDGSDL